MLPFHWTIAHGNVLITHGDDTHYIMLHPITAVSSSPMQRVTSRGTKQDGRSVTIHLHGTMIQTGPVDNDEANRFYAQLSEAMADYEASGEHRIYTSQPIGGE